MIGYLIIFNLILLISADEKVQVSIDISDSGLNEQEIDKLLFCGVLFQYKLHEDEKELKDMGTKFNVSSMDEVFDKVGSDILYNCVNAVKIEVAQIHFKNGQYKAVLKDEDYQKYEKYYEVDYSRYTSRDDLILSDEEYNMTDKFKKAYEIHHKILNEINKKTDESRRKEYEKSKEKKRKEEERVKAIENNLLNLPNYVKAIIFIIVFGVFFGGCFYFIRSKSNKEKKDKKKKKKNQ